MQQCNTRKRFFSPLSQGEGQRVGLLLLLIFLVSCGDNRDSKDIPLGTSVQVKEDIQVSILPIAALEIPDASATRAEKADTSALQVTYPPVAMTRADISKTTAEKEVKTAYVVQFDGTSPTSKAVWVSGDVAAQLNSGSQIPCYFELASGVKSRVYVVANPKNAPTLGTTLQAFETVPYIVSTLPSTGLPMAASQDVALGDLFDIFTLKNPLARLTFTTNTGSLTLRGIPSSYSLVPATASTATVRPSGVTYTSTSLTSGTTYYVPANLSGRVTLSSPILRCSLFAPSNSMYVAISANSATYNIYLGDSSDSDFNVVSNFAYTIGATVGGTDGVDLRVNTPTSITALDGSGTANCYIAPSPNTWYSFNATVMGNGKSIPGYTSAGAPSGADCPDITPTALNPASADVLWETQNTPSGGSTKNSVVIAAYSVNGRLLFRTGSNVGNAVVAIRNASKTILWSWHIWRTGFNPASTARGLAAIGSLAAAGSIVMMDRNLGALSAVYNDASAAGLHYQWGRKDPFPGFIDVRPLSGSMNTLPGGLPVTSGAKARQSVAYSIMNPTTFIRYDGDWCSSPQANLWGTPVRRDLSPVSVNNGVATFSYNANKGAKSIYDPCPVDWRVPPAYVWAMASRNNTSWFSYGRELRGITISTSGFPVLAAGYRHYGTGDLGFIGEAGRYWTSARHIGLDTNENSTYLNFHQPDLSPANYAYQAYGYSVRCVKE